MNQKSETLASIDSDTAAQPASTSPKKRSFKERVQSAKDWLQLSTTICGLGLGIVAVYNTPTVLKVARLTERAEAAQSLADKNDELAKASADNLGVLKAQIEELTAQRTASQQENSALAARLAQLTRGGEQLQKAMRREQARLAEAHSRDAQLSADLDAVGRNLLQVQFSSEVEKQHGNIVMWQTAATAADLTGRFIDIAAGSWRDAYDILVESVTVVSADIANSAQVGFKLQGMRRDIEQRKGNLICQKPDFQRLRFEYASNMAGIEQAKKSIQQSAATWNAEMIQSLNGLQYRASETFAKTLQTLSKYYGDCDMKLLDTERSISKIISPSL